MKTANSDSLQHFSGNKKNENINLNLMSAKVKRAASPDWGAALERLLNRSITIRRLVEQ